MGCIKTGLKHLKDGLQSQAKLVNTLTGWQIPQETVVSHVSSRKRTEHEESGQPGQGRGEGGGSSSSRQGFPRPPRQREGRGGAGGSRGASGGHRGPRKDLEAARRGVPPGRGNHGPTLCGLPAPHQPWFRSPSSRWVLGNGRGGAGGARAATGGQQAEPAARGPRGRPHLGALWAAVAPPLSAWRP